MFGEHAFIDSIKWSIIIAVGIMAIRWVFIQFTADPTHDIDNEQLTQKVARLNRELAACRLRISSLENIIASLHRIEIEGAQDIALLGVWIEQLKIRVCPTLEQCPGTKICESMVEVFGRVSERRGTKEKLFLGEDV